MKLGYRTALLLCVVLAGRTSLGADQVTIYRDSWGVPHVFGETEEAAAYGHGYAQAEDRLEDLLGAYRIALGRAAAVFGEGALATDRIAHMARHERVARERYPSLSVGTRRLVEAFVRGVWAYMDEHPQRVPAWAERPEPHHVVALFRAFAFVWPWGRHTISKDRATRAQD